MVLAQVEEDNGEGSEEIPIDGAEVVSPRVGRGRGAEPAAPVKDLLISHTGYVRAKPLYIPR